MTKNTRKPKNSTRLIEDFMHRSLQHVLPNGIIKLRDNGVFSPEFRPQQAILIVWVMFSMLLVACGTATPEASVTPEVTGTVAPEEIAPTIEGESVESIQEVATVVSERTPVPTFTPDPVDLRIEEYTTQMGLAGRSFLGLRIEDWINIGISALIILVGYFIFIKLMLRVSRWIVKRSASDLDDEILTLITRYINWLLFLLLIRFAFLRLDFLSERMRINFNDLFFVFIIVTITVIAWEIIRFLAQRYEKSLESSDEQRKLSPIIITVQRLALSVFLIVALSVLLTHFGFDISIIAVILIIAGFVISFGAQDILSDILSGYLILIDQPFRVGDAIRVEELDKLGRVIDIGTRSTHIKTGDNREVIIPNSKIGQSSVVNYTYPDPRFRAETEIGVAYGTDIEEMRNVIDQAVRSVEGVLSDKPVDIYYLKFGDSARMVRVRWWIDTYRDEKIMLDKVNAALELALDKAGIELPNITYDLNVKNNE